MTDCPSPSRCSHATEGRAWLCARGTELVPYRCPCGRWHLAPRDEAMTKRAAGR